MALLLLDAPALTPGYVSGAAVLTTTGPRRRHDCRRCVLYLYPVRWAQIKKMSGDTIK